MALETATFLDELVSTNPLASDNVSQGDNHLRLLKAVLQSSFPSVDMAVNAIHASSSAPAESISAGLVWFDTSANVLKIRNEANDAWVTLAVSPVTSYEVDLNGAKLILDADADTYITADTDDQIDITIAGADDFQFTANTFGILAGSTIVYEGATADAYETTLTVVDPTADRTVSLPNATDTLVGKATTDTLTNKTLTSPTINAGALTGAFTGTADLTGLVLQGASPIVLEGSTSDAYETTIAVTDPTADRTWTIPNSTDTFVGKATTDTFTNKTLTSPTINAGALTGAFTGTADLTALVLQGASPLVFEGATADAYETTLALTDPTADRTLTLPNATDTLVGKATTDTLTNKTMASSSNTFDNATTSAKGMASFSSDNFSVSSGAVTIKDAGVANAELANMAANTIKVRDANSSGVPSDVALATTQVLIGDGTGFTAAALSSDVTMTNAGVVTIADNAVSLAKMAGLARGKIIYGDSSGDPAALAVGSADYVLTSDGTDISWVAATTGDITGVGVTSPITGGGTSGSVTIAIQDASTSAKGAASFSSDNFAASSGAITIKDAGVANAELANMAANTIKVRDANSSGVPSDKALATTQILIGDGTGFTAAALSGDVTMTNAGAVTIAANSVDGTMIAMGSDAQGDVMYYDGTNWARLGYGTDGHFLKTQGASANPVWAASSGGGASDIDGLSDALVENNSIWLGNDPSGTTDTASNNVAVGTTALDAVTTADETVAIGYNALTAATTGTANTAVGSAALAALTTGSQNVSMGKNSSDAITEGDNNVAVGDGALSATTTADDNTALGTQTLKLNTTGAANTAVGKGALYANTTASYCNAVGSTALDANTTGTSNNAFGYNALGACTTGNRNTAVGHESGKDQTTANDNTSIGNWSLKDTTTGSNNIAVGTYALRVNTTGNANAALGWQALILNTTGVQDVAVGYNAGASQTTAGSTVAIGYTAGYSATTGGYNTSCGAEALYTNITGVNSTAIGFKALRAATANNNTAVGLEALLVVSTGYANTGVGNYAGNSITTGVNNTCLGNDADATAVDVSNEFTLGNSSVDNLRCNDTSISALSDERDKAEVSNLPSVAGLDFINSLRPITYYWDRREWYEDGESDGSKINHDYDSQVSNSGQRMGFIAQEVEESLSGMKYMEDSKMVGGTEEKLEFAPAQLVTSLVKAIQQLSEEVESLKAQLEG
jgi:hypothetical protein